jgi:MFS family permease
MPPTAHGFRGGVARGRGVGALREQRLCDQAECAEKKNAAAKEWWHRAPVHCMLFRVIRMSSGGETTSAADWRSLALLFGGNVLFAAGLFVHAFLFNFYLRELQLPASVMGHQVAAMTIGGLCALLPAGVIIDRIGTRSALLGGVVCACVGLTLTALARDPIVIYVAAFMIGLGGASCRVAWGPAIMRMTTDASRARAFTWNAALLIGTGSGWTYLSGVLPTWSARLVTGTGLTGIQLVLLAGAVITAGSALCYLPLRLPLATHALRGRPRIELPGEVRVLVPLIAFWMLAAALVLPFFNIYFASRFAMPVPQVGALFATTHLFTAVILVGAAELARRWGPRRMLLFWMVLFPPALLWLSAIDVLSVAVALYFVQGLIAPATNPLIDQVLLERTPRERHGIVAGWRNAAAEGAGAIGASAGGRLLDVSSFSVLFFAAGAVAAASAALLTAGLRARRAPAMLLPDAGAR